MIIIPKTENLEVEVSVTFGCLIEEKEELKEEAEKRDISVGKLVRRKLFPRK